MSREKEMSPKVPCAFRLDQRRLRDPAAAPPPSSALSALPANIDLDTAKAAIEQVNRRLDAELALKSATEMRAMALAEQCTTLLSAITAAVLVEAYGSRRSPLIAAGIAGGLCLFLAVLFAYNSAKPRKDMVLPGCLPDELWGDLVAPDMKGAKFIGAMLLSLQDAMATNEAGQEKRAVALDRAILLAKVAVPLACAAAWLAFAAGPRVGPFLTMIGL
jgi:hypothetical protein